MFLYICCFWILNFRPSSWIRPVKASCKNFSSIILSSIYSAHLWSFPILSPGPLFEAFSKYFLWATSAQYSCFVVELLLRSVIVPLVISRRIVRSVFPICSAIFEFEKPAFFNASSWYRSCSVKYLFF